MNEIHATVEMRELSLLSPHNAMPFMEFVALNPLVAAAIPLLLLMVKLQQTRQIDTYQIEAFRQRILNEIVQFAEEAQALNCSARLILAARYCLCTALDETVLSTTWGNQSSWPNQTLLSTVHKETWGGERFFIILEEMSKNPVENLPLLELLYIILSLGFEGKYYDQSQDTRNEVRNRLFQVISYHRDEPERILSPTVKLLQKTTIADKYFPKWKIALLTLVLLLGAAVIFNLATYLSATKMKQELLTIEQETPRLVISADAVLPPKSTAPVPAASLNPDQTHSNSKNEPQPVHHHRRHSHR